MSNDLDMNTTYRLIRAAARERRYLSYTDIAKENGVELNRREISDHLGALAEYFSERGYPVLLGAIIVRKENVNKDYPPAGGGFYSKARELGIYYGDKASFLKAQRQAVYRWADEGPDNLERLGDEQPIPPEPFEVETYDINEIIADGCFLPKDKLLNYYDRLGNKKNLILQGPPGTGKTWLAKRLGYALLGTQNQTVTRRQMQVIQFHPSMSYEDFVRGWRPSGKSGERPLELTDGIFLKAIQAAKTTPDQPFVFVIEEINRGNPAQIFGEMLTLLEKDKRREDEAIELAYRYEDGKRVHIPGNFYVIGTMNIADRSLALVDYALRRRFAFVTLQPELNDRWKAWCRKAGVDDDSISEIKIRMDALNGKIANDRSLGAQFGIGHSFVTPAQDEPIDDARSWFLQVVKTEIGPLLEEYWFDNPDKAESETQELLKGW